MTSLIAALVSLVFIGLLQYTVGDDALSISLLIVVLGASIFDIVTRDQPGIEIDMHFIKRMEACANTMASSNWKLLIVRLFGVKMTFLDSDGTVITFKQFKGKLYFIEADRANTGIHQL